MMNENIQKALKYLEDANTSGYFSEMDKVIPSDQKNTLNNLRNMFIFGKTSHDFNQQLDVFAKMIQQSLNQSIEQDFSENKEILKEDDTFEMIESGVFKNQEGKFKMTTKPTVFFSDRLAKAFPGVRGLKWFEGQEAIKRLLRLLKNPTYFDIAKGYGIMCDPIWWFRSGSALEIRSFERLDDGRCLMDRHELKVSKIAVYVSGSYYKSFVYVETEADIPIGLYDYSEIDINSVNSRRAFDEEYGLYKGIPITRPEYEDGATEINGEIVDIEDAEFRKRYLTNYNFIISSKASPLNTQEGDRLGIKYMNELLKKQTIIEGFIEEFDLLERNELDY
jgi:hypothetical protein